MSESKNMLEQYASEIREELKVPKQSDVFRAAVEAGYLAALADGEVDATEREVIVQAVELLSEGLVIEWETESLLEELSALAEKDGADARAKQCGATLKELGKSEAGLLVAALVARATNGVAKSEADVLKAVGKAAGLKADKVKEIVKKASSLYA
ncbi:MAG: TerB family tellurite resistance protein [Myxococcales bacterium]|nr:TerB family tellurite resistance protein [Myxococcales bacterium]